MGDLEIAKWTRSSTFALSTAARWRPGDGCLWSMKGVSSKKRHVPEYELLYVVLFTSFASQCLRLRAITINVQHLRLENGICTDPDHQSHLQLEFSGRAERNAPWDAEKSRGLFPGECLTLFNGISCCYGFIVFA